ncbi:hypothetical protein BKA69DRAFT_1098929 [Paraphysoderma sedebokerense]|nr:hypothetical protein BKA69DRAFT_1098929 [Paraphysoderma sedebokerense]
MSVELVSSATPVSSDCRNAWKNFATPALSQRYRYLNCMLPLVQSIALVRTHIAKVSAPSSSSIKSLALVRSFFSCSFASSAQQSTALSKFTSTSRIATFSTSVLLNQVSKESKKKMENELAQVQKVVIIGSGPAAHTAAIYSARANLNPVLYEGFMAGGVAAGGQLMTTTEIENFPGFPKGISGPELMDRMREQSVHCGTKIITETVASVDLSSRPFKLWVEGQDPLKDKPVLTDSLIVATGATAKRLFIPGEDKFWNAGMSACAVCDGPAPIFRNKPLAVIGGGDSACEEATFLTKYASKVFMLVRRDQLRASKVMAERAMKNPKIEILWNTVPVEAHGDRLLSHITIQSTVDKTTKSLPVNGFFYAIGHLPNTSFLMHPETKKGQLEVDSDGYLIVKKGGTETNIEGVFACGDVQDRKYRQAISAAGSGCMAALDCERWLEGQEAAHKN